MKKCNHTNQLSGYIEANDVRSNKSEFRDFTKELSYGGVIKTRSFPMDIGGKSYTINYWQNETQVSIIQYQILEDSASGSWGQALAVVGVLALAASCYYFPAAVTGIIAIGEMMGRDFVR